MDDNNNKCAHGGCVCGVSGDSEYCSSHCNDAEDQDLVEISCQCGHAGCGTS